MFLIEYKYNLNCILIFSYFVNLFQHNYFFFIITNKFLFMDSKFKHKKIETANKRYQTAPPILKKILNKFLSFIDDNLNKSCKFNRNSKIQHEVILYKED